MKTKNIILYLVGLLVFCSCQDMFEPADENNRQLDDLTEESKYAHGLLMYAYDRLPYLTTTTTDIATDDAVSNQTKNNNYLDMATGTWASDNDPMSQWNNCKDGIQYVNLFLTIVNQVKWAPSAVSKQQMFVDRMKGEAHALRALFYYYLLQAHGGYADDGVLYGVPLLTTPEDGASDFNQPRATFAQCIKQIFDDCDVAIKLLPMEYKEYTNASDIPEKYQELGAILAHYNAVFGVKSKNLISAKVAQAIKAQAALLAASPAFRDQSGVTSAQAATYCAEVLDGIGGLDGFDMTGNIWYKNKTAIEDNADIPEILWRADRTKNASQEFDNFPPMLDGNGRVNPSQNLVDAFPMRNGLPITAAGSGYNAQDPYAGRDPRLAQYILYNGVNFRSVTVCSGTYPYIVTKSSTTYEYYDDNLNHGAGSTRTGYYLLKLLRDDVNPLASSRIEQNHYYPRIRYTEIFLAYAEAANDAWGPKSDPQGIGYTAYDVIKKIRERAGLGTNSVGMPLPEGDAYLEDCANDKEKMTNLIRNERRIELCFENKRFWDMRRWLLPLNEPVNGMQVDLIDKTKDPTADNLKYTVIHVEDRVFAPYQCYGPIPRGEVLKWSELKQNKGWQ